MVHSKQDQSILQHLGGLTARERQIVALVCSGHQNKVIARRLQVSEGTVKTHLHAIYLKLGIKNRASLIDRVGDVQTAKPNKV